MRRRITLWLVLQSVGQRVEESEQGVVNVVHILLEVAGFELLCQGRIEVGQLADRVGFPDKLALSIPLAGGDLELVEGIRWPLQIACTTTCLMGAGLSLRAVTVPSSVLQAIRTGRSLAC